MTKIKEQIENTSINVPAKNNPLLSTALQKVNANEELKALWNVINVNAIDRLGMSDHGPVHFQIVANLSLKIARMLKKHDIKTNIEKDYDLSYEHSELVLFLAALMHDLGMTINRRGHEEFSLVIANPILKEILDFLPLEERVVISSETLHSIISHRKGGTPYTLEAGILRVADALDMSEGRSRLAYEKGAINIHSVSAAAINKMEIFEGKSKPIDVVITMNNSTGLFQIDELLKEKIKGSGLEKYMSILAIVENETEKNLVKEFKIDL